MNQIITGPIHGEILGSEDTVPIIAVMSPLKNEVQTIYVPVGTSLTEAIDRIGEECRVSRLANSALVTINGEEVPEEWWDRVRVKQGAVIRVDAVPTGGKGGLLKSILQLGLVLLATLVAGPAAGALGFAAGTVGFSIASAVISGAIMAAGGLLLGAMFPPSTTATEKEDRVYSISAMRNTISKWGPVPVVLGNMRVAPLYASSPYTEYVGNDQFLTMLFVWAYGPIAISDLRIGETPVALFKDVEIQTFEGLPNDGQQTLYPGEVITDDYNIELKLGVQHTRTSAEDAYKLAIDIVLPSGLYNLKKREGGKENFLFGYGIYIAPAGSGAFQLVVVDAIAAATSKPVRITKFIELPVDGKYDVVVVKTTFDSNDDDWVADSNWTGLRSYRRSPPIEFNQPLAITAIRIRASEQLNGPIEDLNGICSSRGQIWTGTSWIASGNVRNPAALFRMVLQSAASAKYQNDDRIDLPTLQAWSEYCDFKGFCFDMFRNFRTSIPEVLRDIAAAGRAVPILRDGKWSVAWETIDAPIIQHFTPRNSRNFRWTAEYRDLPHALRVKYVNRDKKFVEDERLVFDDGYDKQNAALYEQAEFPGVTDPANIFKHARYRIADARLRTTSYFLDVDAEFVRCTRGDRIVAASDILTKEQFSGRIVEYNASNGEALTDEQFFIETGVVYGVRIRNVKGESSVHGIGVPTGWNRRFGLPGIGLAPGDLYTIGPINKETRTYRVFRISPKSDFEAEIELRDDAPGIQSADTGPITGDEGLRPPAISPGEVAPRNLRATILLETSGGKSVWVTRIFWEMASYPGIVAYEVVATLEGTPITARQTVASSDLTARFEDLEAGKWTFVVRGILNNNLYTRFSAPLIYTINYSNVQNGSYITDLTLTNAISGSLNEFIGAAPEFEWINNMPGFPVGPSAVSPVYAGNIVRMVCTKDETILREERVMEPKYTYGIDKNRADNAGYSRSATRYLRIEVACVDQLGRVSPFVALEAYNPPPEAILPTVIPSFERVMVKYTLPNVPDIVGVIIWLSSTSGFNPYTTTPILEAQASGFTVFDVPSGTKQYLRIAAYDTFGRDDFNPSPEVVVESLKAGFDTVPPGRPTGLTATSVLVDGGKAKITYTWNKNPEDDILGYFLEVRQRFADGTASNWLRNEFTDNKADVFVRPGETWEAIVFAFDILNNRSQQSDQLSHTAIVDTVPPAVPTNVIARAAFTSGVVSWSSGNEADLAGFEVYQSEDGATPAVGASPTYTTTGPSTPISGLKSGVSTYFWVRAVDTSKNKSAWSARAAATTVSIVEADLPNQIIAGRMLKSADLITLRAQIGNAVIDDAHISNMSAGKLTAYSTITGTLLVDGAYNLNNPASGVNRGSTQINPGSISLYGPNIGGSLTDWRSGGDITKINGGAISANTIDANKLVIGQRGVSTEAIVFEHNSPSNNSLRWSSGRIYYTDDNNNPTFIDVSAGSQGWPGATFFVYWQKGTNYLQATTSTYVAQSPNNVLLATYSGGTELSVGGARTVIDGNNIKTGSIDAQRVNVASLQAGILTAQSIKGYMVDATNLIATTGFVDQLRANMFTARRIVADEIVIGGVVMDNLANGAATEIAAGYVGSGSGIYISVAGQARVLVHISGCRQMGNTNGAVALYRNGGYITQAVVAGGGGYYRTNSEQDSTYYPLTGADAHLMYVDSPGAGYHLYAFSTDANAQNTATIVCMNLRK